MIMVTSQECSRSHCRRILQRTIEPLSMRCGKSLRFVKLGVEHKAAKRSGVDQGQRDDSAGNTRTLATPLAAPWSGRRSHADHDDPISSTSGGQAGIESKKSFPYGLVKTRGSRITVIPLSDLERINRPMPCLNLRTASGN